MPRKHLICFLAVLVAIGAGVSLYLRTASGHADYARAEPAADAVVSTVPTQVRIWFTQELFRRQGVNKIEVLDAAGNRVDQGDVTIDDDDRTLMQVMLAPALPDGVYTVRWQSLSAEDGHEGKGEFTFTVEAGTATNDTAAQAEASPTAALPTPPATATTAPPTAAPPTASPTVAPAAPTSGLPCVGGAAPLLVVLGGILTRRRGAPHRISRNG